MMKFSKLHLNELSANEENTIQIKQSNATLLDLTQEQKPENITSTQELHHDKNNNQKEQNNITQTSLNVAENVNNSFNVQQDKKNHLIHSETIEKKSDTQDQSQISNQLKIAYQNGIKDTKKKLFTIIQYLKNYKNTLDLEKSLKLKIDQLAINDEYTKSNFLKFSKNIIILVLDQLFLTLPFDHQKFFSSLEKEISRFYSHGKIIIKVHPKDLTTYKQSILKTSLYTKYSEAIEIVCDQNITEKTCHVVHNDIALYFDHNKLTSLLKNLIEINL